MPNCQLEKICESLRFDNVFLQMIEDALVHGLRQKKKKVLVDLTDNAAFERKKRHLDRARSELGALSPIRLVRI